MEAAKWAREEASLRSSGSNKVVADVPCVPDNFESRKNFQNSETGTKMLPPLWQIFTYCGQGACPPSALGGIFSCFGFFRTFCPGSVLG